MLFRRRRRTSAGVRIVRKEYNWEGGKDKEEWGEISGWGAGKKKENRIQGIQTRESRSEIAKMESLIPEADQGR